MVDRQALDAIAELLRAHNSPTIDGSTRIPEPLLIELENVLLRGALDALYEEDRQARPTPEQVRQALAQLDGSPLAP